MIGVRVDIDAVGDIKAVPSLLNLFDEHDIRASFFIAFGPDRVGRNLFKYIQRPWDIPKAKPGRYGFGNLLRSFFNPQIIEGYKTQLIEIEKRGHEVGLHGYDHYNWVREKRDIQKGLESFREVFGKKPRAFASPGFKTNSEYLRALDCFGFDYASDFLGSEPVYPLLNGKKADTMQIPVSIKSIGELSINGQSDEQILRLYSQGMENEFFTFYLHPSYEVNHNYSLLCRVFQKVGKMGTATFSEIWRQWR
ncbi:MAG: polysaccharide deacetylase family protein [Candidatus Hydrothermarchaeales archaeon]